jgi:DNA-binding Lrp family transcriptional regulator
MVHEMDMDGFDREILKALQADSALTNAALGEVVNLSASQCSRRRMALETEGVITGYMARLDPLKLDFGLRAIIRVNLRGHSAREDDSFVDFIHHRLLPHPQVAQVRSEIVLKTIKSTQGLPLE